jgi:TonB-linked SusC/RagA family outer membrane protein
MYPKLRRISFLLLTLLSCTIVFAQQRDVTGVITSDETKEPLQGVTVAVKGTDRSTVTDEKGQFTITVSGPESVLKISSVGFLYQEITVGNKSSIAITMGKDFKSLEDVVVVGYAPLKRAHLTGAVETFNPKEVEDLPVSNLGAALAGRVLGLSVSGGMRRPGSVSSLTVRNPMTLSKDGGTNDPLYVIDGIIQVDAQGKPDANYFNTLDASEVESISVLKDASAAVYGSRAVNGVILITTKRGKAGKPRISYSGSVANNDEMYRTKMLSAYDYARYYNIMNGPNGANKTLADKSYIFSDDELEHYKTIDYNRLEDAWHSATNTRHTLNLSGGSENATYFAGGSYYNQTGNLATLDYQKWTFRGGTDIKISNGFKVGLQLAGNYQNKTKTFNKIGGEQEENDYRNLILTPRMVPDYVDGYPIMLNGWRNNNVSGYHFGEIERLANKARDKDRFFNVNSYAEYEAPFLKGLKARVSYAKNFGFSRGSQLGSVYYLYKITGSGTNDHIYDEGATVQTSSPQKVKNGDRLYYSNVNSESYQTNFTLSYEKEFRLHNISAVFSVEKEEASSTEEDVQKETPIASSNGQFGSAFGEIDGRTFAYESGALGYVGRVNYAYNDKYLAEFLFRTDASTKFAPENYWGDFYSASVGWVISKERFFEKVNAVNFLKIRYSLGLLGKDDTKPWQWRQRFTYQGDKGAVFGGNEDVSTGMKMEASPNRNATWSNELKNNLGIDARFLRNRLSATVELFYNHATDMLMERTAIVPITVGGSLAAENWGIANFYGYELGLGWRNTVGRDFSYGIDTRFTWYDNKMLQGDFAETDQYYPWVAHAGQSTDIGQWGYDYIGMFKTQEEIDAYVSKYGITSVFGTSSTKLKPGMLYYSDVRGALQPDGTFAGPDGKIDDNDQIQLSKKADNHYGFGITLKAGYRGLSLDCVIGGSFGGWSEVDNTSRKVMEDKIEDNYINVPEYWKNIYDPVLNPGGKYPNPYWEDISLDPSSQFWKVSSFRMVMRNVNLSYTLPKKIVDQVKISNARIYLSVLNPAYLFNPYSYKAPDGSYQDFPDLRTYSVGVNVSL